MCGVLAAGARARRGAGGELQRLARRREATTAQAKKRIKKTLRNSAVVMRYDFAAGLSLLALREILRSCDVGDGPRI